MGALAEWGVTMDKLVRSPEPTPEERVLLEGLAREVDVFVRGVWREDEWETAWFVNPPVSDCRMGVWDVADEGGLGSDCRACRAWRIYTSLRGASPLRRSRSGRRPRHLTDFIMDISQPIYTNITQTLPRDRR